MSLQRTNVQRLFRTNQDETKQRKPKKEPKDGQAQRKPKKKTKKEPKKK